MSFTSKTLAKDSKQIMINCSGQYGAQIFSAYEEKQRFLAVARDVFGCLVCVICGDLVRTRSV